ncbi:MAG: hypothetical protein PSY14_15615 [bacterium]|nr:hypothetical protein [bacterium]
MTPATSRIRIVGSFDELVNASFGPEVNAICWARQLPGNFDEIAALLADEDDIVSLDEDAIAALHPRLSAEGRIAADALLADRALLQERGLLPSLECVPRYPRDDDNAVPTDVYSFHADRAPVQADTYLCSYNEASSEGLDNAFALRRVDDPATRARLQDLFAAEGGGSFEEYLRENCYDLHYAPLPEAVRYSFGIGNLWRIAVEYPGCPVPPCIHRAPDTVDGRPPRLLLIS